MRRREGIGWVAATVFMAAEREKQIEQKKQRDAENAKKENEFYAAWGKAACKRWQLWTMRRKPRPRIMI